MKFNFTDYKKIEADPYKVVTNPDILTANADFSEDGIQSARIFGSQSESNYSCSCGKTSGRFSKGMMCPKCKTNVIENITSEKTGWIILKDTFLINPILFHFISKVMPIDKILGKGTDCVYCGIGMDEFHAKFDEILEHYSKKTKKKEHVEMLLKNRDSIFTDKIFISGIAIRPAKIMNGKLTYDKLNNFYSNILQNSVLLEKKGLINSVRQMLIYEMQQKYNESSQYVFDMLSKKNGAIRNLLLGYRVNFSSRSVIVPGRAEHKLSEISIPYMTFFEMMRYHIINLIMEHWGLDYLQANRRVVKAKRVFDEKLYNFAVKKLIVEHDTRVIFNRNPTIGVGSMLQLRITEVHRDMNDFTMAINSGILGLLSGDYDGDTLNMFLLIDDNFRDFLDPLNPTNLIIDSNTGMLNEILSIDRDVVTGLNNFIK